MKESKNIWRKAITKIFEGTQQKIFEGKQKIFEGKQIKIFEGKLKNIWMNIEGKQKYLKESKKKKMQESKKIFEGMQKIYIWRKAIKIFEGKQ